VGANERQHSSDYYSDTKWNEPGAPAHADCHLFGGHFLAIPGGEIKMKKSRRKFLRDTACGLTAAAVVNSLDRLSIISAMVQQQPEVASDYKALVCVFLN